MENYQCCIYVLHCVLFDLVFVVLCTQCCQFLWIAHFMISVFSIVFCKKLELHSLHKDMALLSPFFSFSFFFGVFHFLYKFVFVYYIYTKKKVKYPHVFLKWQMIQVSRDYWPDNLKNAMVTCQNITLAVRNKKKRKKNVNLMNI
jgi:hypothetical protein